MQRDRLESLSLKLTLKTEQTGMSALPLEVQLETKLKLPRIIDRGRLAVITAVARALPKRIDSAKLWIRGRFIEAIEEVEAFRD